jgi:hypothetical protein
MASVLRCRDLEDALASVSALYGVEQREIVRVLPRAADHSHADPDDPIGALPNALARELAKTPRAPSSIHYFHGTRVRDPTAFARHGLLSLEQVLDALWTEIRSLAPEVSEEQLLNLRADLTAGRVGPSTYCTRVADSQHHGPCGHLLRDVFLHPRDYSSVDYFAGAEIVIDICHAIEDRFQIDASRRYREQTTACVVEFSAPTESFGYALSAALWYVESGLRGARTMNANWGYGGDGMAIAPEAIISVLARQELLESPSSDER